MQSFIKYFSSFSKGALSSINSLPLLAESWTYKKISGKEIEIGTLSSDKNVPNTVCVFTALRLWGHFTSQCAIQRIPGSFHVKSFFKNRQQDADSKLSCFTRETQMASQRWCLAGCQGKRFNCSEVKILGNKKGKLSFEVMGRHGEERMWIQCKGSGFAFGSTLSMK